MALMTLLTNVVREPELAASASKAESLPSFQPPIASETLTPLLCPRVTSERSLFWSGIACRVPLEFGSANA